jgi:hypothetical protein
MAKEPGSDEPTKRIRVDIDRSRDRLARDVRGLRYELDFPGKVRRSFQRQTTLWIVAAVAVGVIVVTLPRTRKKVRVDMSREDKGKKKLAETGMLLGILKIAMPFVKPVVMNFIRSRMTGGASTSHRPTSKARF